MGYEVLDSRGSARLAASAGEPGAVEVVELDGAGSGSLEGAEPPPPPLPLLRRRAQAAVRAVATAVATSPRTARRRAAVLAALVTASALVGALVAGVVVQRRQQDQREHERRGLLAAAATVTNYAPAEGPEGTVANLTVNLTNLGPRPIDVLTTPDGPTRGTTVDLLADEPTVASGAKVLVTLLVPVTCDDLAVDNGVSIPVRTADRRMRAVPVQMPFGGEHTLRQMICDSSQGLSVQPSITGSVNRPVLSLQNDSDKDVSISLDATTGIPPVEDGGPAVRVTTVPGTPFVVRADSSRKVRLVITARRCRPDVALLLSGSYLTVVAASTDGEDSTETGVDIGALMGVALAQTCSRGPIGALPTAGSR